MKGREAYYDEQDSNLNFPLQLGETSVFLFGSISHFCKFVVKSRNKICKALPQCLECM